MFSRSDLVTLGPYPLLMLDHHHPPVIRSFWESYIDPGGLHQHDLVVTWSLSFLSVQQWFHHVGILHLHLRYFSVDLPGHSQDSPPPHVLH